MNEPTDSWDCDFGHEALGNPHTDECGGINAPRVGVPMELDGERVIPTYVRPATPDGAGGFRIDADSPTGWYLEFRYVGGAEQYRHWLPFPDLCDDCSADFVTCDVCHWNEPAWGSSVCDDCSASSGE